MKTENTSMSLSVRVRSLKSYFKSTSQHVWSALEKAVEVDDLTETRANHQI